MIIDKFKKIEIDNNDLSKYVDEYLGESNYSDSSKRAKKYALQIFIDYHSSRKSFFFLVEDLNKYRRHLDYNLNKSKFTVRNYLSTLNLFFNYLIDKNILEKNPIKRIKYSIKQEKKELKYFTLHEINSYLNNYTSEFLIVRSRLVFLLLISTNLKIEELTLLKRNDLIKNARSYKLYFNDNIFSFDNHYNKLISTYLHTTSSSNSDFLLLKDKEGIYTSLKPRSLREIIIKIIKELSSEGKPLLTLKNTSILYYLNKTNSLKKVAERFDIKTKNVLNKFKNEKDHFKSN